MKYLHHKGKAVGNTKLQRIKKTILIIVLIVLSVYNIHQYSKIESTILDLLQANAAKGSNVSTFRSTHTILLLLLLPEPSNTT